MIFIKEKLSSPVIKLLRSGNLEFILSFFFYVFRNDVEEIDIISQNKLEKKLKIFIKDFNFETEEEKNEDNSKNYLEEWIKSKFLKRSQINDFGDDYEIELTSYSLEILNFVENLGLEEDLVYASVKSNFENALSNLKDIAFSSSDMKKQNIEEIDNQIAKLQEKKKLIEKGELSSFEDEIYDKYVSAKEILQKMPVEFRKVEAVFENIYRDIQKKSNDIDLNVGNILGSVLDEIDEKINNSPQGKSFEGFEDFYLEKPKELLLNLDKILNNHKNISKLEGKRTIKSIINIDLLKAKKRVNTKKTFIVTKLKDIFNEENIKEKIIGINLIKQIKKITSENLEKINFRDELFEINDGFGIDLFIGKNYWEPRSSMKLKKYIEKKDENNDVDIAKIFKYNNISESRVKNNISKILGKKDKILLTEILEKFPVKYGLDEFITYLKILSHNEKSKILSENKSTFLLKGINNNLEIESNNIILKK